MGKNMKMRENIFVIAIRIKKMKKIAERRTSRTRMMMMMTIVEGEKRGERDINRHLDEVRAAGGFTKRRRRNQVKGTLIVMEVATMIVMISIV
jgi:hypothetical protein